MMFMTNAPPTPAPRDRRQGQKSSVACNFCRSKKIKCNSGRPCTNCADHRILCHYTDGQRRRNHTTKDYQGLQDRLTRVEALLSSPQSRDASGGAKPDERAAVAPCNSSGRFQAFTFQVEQITEPEPRQKIPPPPITVTDTLDHAIQDPQRPEDQSVPLSPIAPAAPNVALPSLAPTPAEHAGTHPNEPTLQATQSSPSKTVIESPGEDDGSSTSPPEEELNYEYHGPGSFLSICSKSGIEWVTEKTGVADFSQIARSLTGDVSRALKLPGPVPTSREPEPEEYVAWEYTRTYFEEDTDSTYGIVHRPTFENMLRTSFRKDGHSEVETDPAWYAMRNLIYAAGCRIIDVKASAKSSRKSTISSRSWRYFLNALSVHTELLYYRTSLMAIQAIVMMACYVEAVGCPSLDYMLCSSAMRLAQSKGLHRQPAAAWNLSKLAIQSRSFLWWAIYGYERQNASRAGRPLAIDDNDISCQLPNEVPTGSRINLPLMRAAYEIAKLSGQINQKIAALKLGKASLEDLSRAITDSSRLLDNWWDNLPDWITDDLCTLSRPLPPHVHIQQVIYLHYARYHALVAIHSILVHPWNTAVLKVEPYQKEQFARLVAISTEVYVNATRKFINNLPQLDITALTPKWLVYVSPLSAVINLFIYVLQHPGSPDVQSDIGLMSLVAGHFSYLEFATSDRSCPFVWQIANLARLAVNKARERDLEPIDEGIQMDSSNAGEMQEQNGEVLGYDPVLLDGVELDAGNYEQWATLIGWPDVDNLADIDNLPDIDMM